MKQPLRSLFSPLLKPFESGNEPFQYKPSQRKILLFVSLMFTGLAGLVLYLAADADPGYYFPAVIFGLIGFVGFVVGFLGNDRAVARIWGSR
ncbi:MAG: hypothetical protein R3208_03835 [Ketobacteraceae bacterium]|nr:hypothetical protein [Ketobacteraceae bacterium]